MNANYQYGKMFAGWDFRPDPDDRRYWVCAMTYCMGGYIYFGCTKYRAVMDDFGELVPNWQTFFN